MEVLITHSIKLASIPWKCKIIPSNLNPSVYRTDILNLTSNNNPDKAISSYDKSRRGTVLGDGGGMLLLEDLESAQKRGARIYCEILGHS